jgi:hypothetical protein
MVYTTKSSILKKDQVMSFFTVNKLICNIVGAQGDHLYC